MDVVGEVEVPGKNVDHDHGRENEALGGGGKVGQILLAALVAFLVLVMGHERIGADADNLVEQIEGQQVIGEGAADGAEQGQGKAGVEARLLVLVEAPHVSRRIEDCDHPQERGGDGEDHGQRVGPQRDAQPRQQVEHAEIEMLPAKHVPNHRGRDDEERCGGNKRAGFAGVRPLAGGHDEAGADQWGQNRQQEPDVVNGFHWPIRSIQTAHGF